MITKCECLHCGQPIEFDAGQFEKASETPYRVLGQEIECPKCQQPTQLYMRRHAAAEAAPNIKSKNGVLILIAAGILIVVLGGFIALQLQHNAESVYDLGSVALEIVSIIFGLLIYFIPTYAAFKRGKRNAPAIFMLNLLAGWTFIGWVAAMVWACMKD